MLKRIAFGSLLKWKSSKTRKPLLVLGARQVGKTFLLESFGKDQFPSYHRFDFAENEELITLFDGSLEPQSLLTRLATYSERDIDPEKELIIFDEIQLCPKALTSLKYFEKHLPHAYVCGSGSLLGVTFSESPFPVGKVDRLDIYPLTFYEFLLGMGEEKIAKEIEAFNLELFANPSIHKKTWQLLLYYFVTGGMPEVVEVFINNYKDINKAFDLVRSLQSKIIRDYEDDFIKYSDHENALHIKTVFREIPAQLTKARVSSSRFVFKGVLSAVSSYRELEGPIEWLEAAKLIFKVPITDHSESPLKAYAKQRLFKLYLFDVGLLGSMVGLSPRSIAMYDYGGFKGFFAENFVLQELKARSAQRDRTVVSWFKRNSELEFLLEEDGKIMPIEVKSGINKKAKSLNVYSDLYKPSRAILLTGNSVHSREGILEYLPLYFAGSL